VIESNSPSYAVPSPKGAPTEAETLRRQAFQAVHPEVGFAFRDGQWTAYWLSADGEPMRAEADTLTGLLGRLAGEFGEQPPAAR